MATCASACVCVFVSTPPKRWIMICHIHIHNASVRCCYTSSLPKKKNGFSIFAEHLAQTVHMSSELRHGIYAGGVDDDDDERRVDLWMCEMRMEKERNKNLLNMRLTWLGSHRWWWWWCLVLGALANVNMAKHDLNAFVDSCHSIVDMGRSSLS